MRFVNFISIFFSSEKYAPPTSGGGNRKVLAQRIILLEEKNVITEYYKKNGGVEREVKAYSDRRNQDVNPLEKYQQDIMNDEKATINAIRSIIQEVMDLVRMRRREEDVQRVDFTIKDENASTKIDEKEVLPDERKQFDITPSHLDYLIPFLFEGKDVKSLTIDEAKQVSDACLSACKDRLLQRGNIIQNRLNEENAKLEDIRFKYQQDENNNVAGVDEFEKASKEVIFRINVLEKRLGEHEHASLEKYKVSGYL